MLTVVLNALVLVVLLLVVTYVRWAKRRLSIMQVQVDSLMLSFKDSVVHLEAIRDLYKEQLARRRYTILVYGMQQVVRRNDVDAVPFLWGITGAVSPGEVVQVLMHAQVSILAGANVICFGDGELKELRLGHNQQSPFGASGSPVCVTQERLQVGAALVALVKGTG
jgi:hypothetical protein